MFIVSSKENTNRPVESIIDERVNELLDLLLLASSLKDEHWVKDVRHRLRQISSHLGAVNRSS
jgi:hypothetical protein